MATRSQQEQAKREQEIKLLRDAAIADKTKPAIQWMIDLANSMQNDLDADKLAITADILEGGTSPPRPKGVMGPTTAGSGWSMGGYTPTQVVQQDRMPARILPEEEEEMYTNMGLFSMKPYRWS